MAKRSALVLMAVALPATSHGAAISSPQELPNVMAAVSGTLDYTSTMPVWKIFSSNN